jgi:hypothetical protein
MIRIRQGDGAVTLINVFACEPGTQQPLIDTWIGAAEDVLGKVPGLLSAALHRSKDGTRVVNYAQFRSSSDWDNLLRLGRTRWFAEMDEYGTKDAHLYEVCYALDLERTADGEPKP